MIWRLANALVRQFPAETAHRLAVGSLSLGLAPKYRMDKHSALLETSVATMRFANPLGLAAGFDKDAQAMQGALGLGFGFVEIGTVTPLPQSGNPRPRVFRLGKDKAVINRYGFNNTGMDAVASRLSVFRQRYQGAGVLGVNIGANAQSVDRIADYYKLSCRLAVFADYLVVNVSSPNTKGLRDLQEASSLAHVLDAAMAGMKDAGEVRPLLLKLSPDLDDAQLEAAIKLADEKKCAGLIIANTTINRPDTLKSKLSQEAGGLSGAPLFAPSTRMLYHCRKIAPPSLALIAAGGVDDAASAYAKLLAGADLVQIYTGFAMKGAGLPRRIIDNLASRFVRDGVVNVTDVVGAGASLEEINLLLAAWPDR